MKSNIGHIQFNIASTNQSFYKDLLGFLGWTSIYHDEHVMGFSGNGNGSIWFVSSKGTEAGDYDLLGENHLGIAVESIKDVDDTVAYLKEKDIEALFETPRHRKEFSSEGTTYYQVMFKSPDNILFEVMYSGPHSA